MSQALPANENLIGREVGGYLILRTLGSGGMAHVYLAEQKSLGRQIALKVLHPRLAVDPAYVERFHNEARAAAALVHPNIVQIYEVGQADSIHFIAQEYVAGKSLDEILDHQGALEQGLVLEILRQVVSALCKAAEVGIVHRDIKPANILFSTSGTVKVADFGLARVLTADSKTLTQVGVAMGTPLYMSPEQIEGRAVDERSDLYSLGVTAYHLLAGEPPYTGETALSIAVQHLNQAPPPLTDRTSVLAPELVAIVHRMLNKQPAERYATSADLLSELKQLASVAARDGWAAGPEQWSLVDWLAAHQSRGESRAQLEQVMREQAQLNPQVGNRRRMILAFIGALLGGLVGLLSQNQRFLLKGTSSAPIPKRDSPEAQLFHAKMVDSEAGWRAVWENFPDVDPFYRRLAEEGLVRHYLLVSLEYRKALPVIHDLAGQANDDDSLRAFTLAADYVCHKQLGHEREAADAYGQLTPPLKDILIRDESQLYDLVEPGGR